MASARLRLDSNVFSKKRLNGSYDASSGTGSLSRSLVCGPRLGPRIARRQDKTSSGVIPRTAKRGRDA